MNKRLDAARRGEKKFLGNRCKRGHEGWRYTKTGACVDCASSANKSYTDHICKLMEAAKK